MSRVKKNPQSLLFAKPVSFYMDSTEEGIHETNGAVRSNSIGIKQDECRKE